jgi:hypothetical protein
MAILKNKEIKENSSRSIMSNLIMLNPHEKLLCRLAGTKTDMSPILTTNIILTKKPHYLDHQFY